MVGKSRIMRRRVVCALILMSVGAPGVVSASLGGNVTSVQEDRVRMQGALRQIVRSGPFTFHEMQTASGIVVREYVSEAGLVFALSWQGATFPDMRQLLGSYYERYHAEAERLARTRRGHGPLTIDLGDVVVQTGGHNRALSGRAYLPQALPQGVGIESIR
jgi:hypothetical protein